MKSLILLIGFMTIFWACETQKTTQNPMEANTTEVNYEENFMISGNVIEVKQEKDGQTLKVINNKGVEYTAILSIPNLKENASQYRKYEIGEYVQFQGDLHENQVLIVREVVKN